MSFEELKKNRLKTSEKHDPNKVRKKKCQTCPFKINSQSIGAEFGIEFQFALQYAIIKSALTERNRYCHHEGLKGKSETWICRGARDAQLIYFHVIGFLEEPTDECWREKTLYLMNHDELH